VLGTELVGGWRRYVRTTVQARWPTTKPAYRVTLAGGTGMVTSGDHRLLTERGWRHVARGWCASGRRAWLRPGDVLVGPGRVTDRAPATRARAYREGYLAGLVRADDDGTGCRRGRRRVERRFPSDHLPLEVLGRAHHFLAATSRSRAGFPALAGTRGTGEWAEGPATLTWPPYPDEQWCAGFLAGVIDARGEVAAGVLRIAHGEEQVLGQVAGALHRLGFAFLVERGTGEECGVVVTGGPGGLLRLLRRVAPVAARCRDITAAPVTGADALRVEAVHALGVELPMYDITTGTGDFVAAGVVHHNCFARQTHTYLDLDAGADFDGQIVVKVNLARVLERELRAPGWRREPVAMGTNTDPYQRAEGRYRLMPGVISALARSGTPFSLLTKGTVLACDLPQLAAAAADVPVGMAVSIALLDRSLQARLEPGTPSPQARLDLVRRIVDTGLPCTVMVAPVLPLLTDSVEALDALLGQIAAAGASGASVLTLHLRPGARQWFLAWLAREHPELVDRYARLYRRGAYVDARYRHALGARVTPLLRRHGLAATATAGAIAATATATAGRGDEPRGPRTGSASPREQLGLWSQWGGLIAVASQSGHRAAGPAGKPAGRGGRGGR